VLSDHVDEVWFVVFSNDGGMLASASKDSTVIIWEMEHGEKAFVLSGHDEPISVCAWSPDGTGLI
jgi:WD40 repeat protein